MNQFQDVAIITVGTPSSKTQDLIQLIWDRWFDPNIVNIIDFCETIKQIPDCIGYKTNETCAISCKEKMRILYTQSSELGDIFRDFIEPIHHKERIRVTEHDHRRYFKIHYRGLKIPISLYNRSIDIKRDTRILSKFESEWRLVLDDEGKYLHLVFCGSKINSNNSTCLDILIHKGNTIHSIYITVEPVLVSLVHTGSKLLCENIKFKGAKIEYLTDSHVCYAKRNQLSIVFHHDIYNLPKELCAEFLNLKLKIDSKIMFINYVDITANTVSLFLYPLDIKPFNKIEFLKSYTFRNTMLSGLLKRTFLLE